MADNMAINLQGRHRRLSEQLEEHGMDFAVLFSYFNYTWSTGLGTPHYDDDYRLVMVPKVPGRKPLIILPSTQEEGCRAALKQAGNDDIFDIRSYHPVTTVECGKSLTAALASWGGQGKKIGIDTRYLTMSQYEWAMENLSDLPDAEIDDLDGCLQPCKWITDTMDMASLYQAGRIARLVMAARERAVCQGGSEKAVVAAAQCAILKFWASEACEFDIGGIAPPNGVATHGPSVCALYGERMADLTAPPTARKPRPGAPCAIFVWVTVNSWAVGLYRTFFFGDPSEEQYAMREHAEDLRAQVARLIPGRSLGDLRRHLKAVMSRSPDEINGSSVAPLGTRPYGELDGEHYLAHRKIPPSVGVLLDLSLKRSGWTYAQADSYVVGADGVVECLTRDDGVLSPPAAGSSAWMESVP